MTPLLVREKITEIAERIGRLYQPKKIILFGSYAYGNPTVDSDVDLLVIKNDAGSFISEQQKVRRIIGGELAADVLIRSDADIDRRLQLGDFFLGEILSQGICLYEA